MDLIPCFSSPLGGPSAVHFQKGWAQSSTSSPAPNLHGDPSQAVLVQAETPGVVTAKGEPPRTGWWWHHKPAPGCVPVPPHQQDTCWEILMVQRPKGLNMWLYGVWGRPCSLPLPQGLHPISNPPSSPLGCDKSCGSLSKSTLYICCLELLQPWTMNSC